MVNLMPPGPAGYDFLRLAAKTQILLEEMEREIAELAGHQQCACIFEPRDYNWWAQEHADDPEVRRPGRCRNSASGEDGLCDGCRRDRHGIGGPHPDAVHAWLDIPLQRMWDRVDKAYDKHD